MNAQQIAHYKELGWEFIAKEWTNGHNGNDEVSHFIKSPRLKKKMGVHDQYNDKLCCREEPWVWMTEEQIIARGKDAYVRQRIGEYSGWRNNHYAIMEAFVAQLLKDPDAKRVTVTVDLEP